MRCLSQEEVDARPSSEGDSEGNQRGSSAGEENGGSTGDFTGGTTSEPRCRLLRFNPTQFCERGPPRREDRNLTSAETGIHRVAAALLDVGESCTRSAPRAWRRCCAA